MNAKATPPSTIAHATVTTPAKASHAQGQSPKIRLVRVTGSIDDFCSMSNEPVTSSNAGFFRTGSSRGDGKGLIVAKICLELGTFEMT
jgi:hypothetical protein